jgi:hemerythrin-like domain-containing protein
MLEQINRLPDPNEYEDPVQFLRAAHVVVTKELNLLSRLLDDAESQGLDHSFRLSSEWMEIFHFFTVSVIQHEDDEEQALFPIVRERVPNLGFQLPDAPIHFLTKGHKLLEQRVADLVQVWKEFQSGRAVDSQSFVASGRELISLYKDHISTEEQAVYKVANEVLTPHERLDIMEIIRRNHSHSMGMDAPQFERPSVSGNYIIVPSRRRPPQ